MTEPFRPADETLRAYLDGEHGPPSDEAVQIIQAELEHAARLVTPPGQRSKEVGA